MDWTMLVAPVTAAAFVSGIISIVGMFVNRATIVRLHQEKLASDAELAERKFKFDKDLARERFSYDRQQAVFKRRFELAEQVLADAYRFRDLMKFVRNGAAWEGEGESRKLAGHESESIRRLRTNYYVPVERLNNNSEFISAMMARQTTCHAHFGAEASQAFDKFNMAIRKVRISSSSLIQNTNELETNENVKSFMEELRCDIWEPLGIHAGKNQIGKEIEEGVALVEKFCRPILEWVD